MLRVRRTWRLTKADWAALPLDEKDELLADDQRRQQRIAEMRDALKESGAMDAAWIVLLALEQL